MAVKNIKAYKEEIDETLEWMSERKTQDEFDKWFYNLGTEVKYIDGVKTISRSIAPVKFRPFTKDTYILGSIDSGMGPDTWGGRLHLVQILVAEGYVDSSVNDDGKVTYKTIKQFP